MPSKNKTQRAIDATPLDPFSAGQSLINSAADEAPPAGRVIIPPDGLTLAAGLEFSAVTPGAYIQAYWNSAPGYELARYVVQISTDSGFADTATETYRTNVNQTSLRVGNRRVLTTYYVQVATIVGESQGAWSASANVTTPADTVPPAAPTGVSATFINAGDLVITWTNPTSPNFRDVEIGIYTDATKTTTLALLYDATGRRVWTAAENLAATSNVGDPTVYVELRSRSWGNLYSAAVSATATKTAPTTPTGLTTSWAGDTGAAGPDCLMTWTTATDASLYTLSIDGVARVVVGGRYVYTLDQNRAEHSGTPDPVLSLSLVATDGLKQSSTAATATATNAAPAAPTLTLQEGFAQIVCQITSPKAADFSAYEFVWKRETTTVLTLESASSEQQYTAATAADSGVHSWTCTVRQRDVFGQYSTATVSSSLMIDALTIGGLRSGTSYSDSDGNTFTAPASGTLAVLKDNVLTTGGVTYAA